MRRLPVISLGLVALTLAMAGCKTSPQKQGADTLANDSVDSLPAVKPVADTLVVDSFTYAYYNADSTVQSTVYVECPTGSDSLSQAVRAFVAKQLGELYIPYSYDEEEEARKKYPRYKGSVDQVQKLADYYGKGAKAFLAEQRKESTVDGDGPSVCSNVKIRKVAETSTYLTFSMTGYYEVGGAHGGFTGYDLNFSKLTNKPILKAIDSSKTRALQKILKKGLERYFKECGDEDFNISSIYAYLDPMGEKGKNNLIPIPASTPYLEKDSLCFVYQQYEIAPYAAGEISFNVALKDIKPYLRQEVRDLLDKSNE